MTAWAEDSSVPVVFQDLRSDYSAAKPSQYKRRRPGLAPMGAGADYHYRSEAEFLKIIETSRDLDRNDIVVGQAVNRLIDNIIQDGFKLDPTTGDDEVDAFVRRLWEEWTEDPEACHSAGELTFLQIERLALRHAVIDGDVFLLPRQDGTLQGIEAHRCRTPSNTKRNVVHGVLLDEETRRRQEFWFTRDDVDPVQHLSKVSDVFQIPARDDEGYRQVFQIYDPERITQTRGVSLIQRVFDTAGMHDDIQFAMLVKQQASACFTILFEQANQPPTAKPVVGERTERPTQSGQSQIIENLRPGISVLGKPGQKISGFSPNIPSPEYIAHVSMILAFVSINLGMPVQMLLLDPSETNFSGWRGAIDQARIGFRKTQRWLQGKLHTPVYWWKLRQWLAERRFDENPDILRRLKDPSVRLFSHRWNRPQWQYIEPLKDAQADVVAVDNFLASLETVHAQRGRDWGQESTKIVTSNAMLIRKAKSAAVAINEEFPEDKESVTWRDVLSPKGGPTSKVVAGEGDDEGKGSENGEGQTQSANQG